MSKSIKLELSVEEINLILNALSNLPYIQVHALIQNVQQQAGPQLVGQNRTAADQQEQAAS